MRKRYRLDMSRPRGQRLVEITQDPGVISPQITPDVAPYRSMITGEMIGGRAQHREHLKRHGCEEIGNERPRMETPEHRPDRRQIREDILRAKDQIEAGMQPTLRRLREESPHIIKDLGLD